QFVFNGGDGGRGVPVERPGPHEFATEGALFRLRDQDFTRAAPGTNPLVLGAIQYYFERTDAEIRRGEKAGPQAEPRHPAALLKFAARACRRPLAQEERDEILAYYRQLREKGGLTHEEAMRGSIAGLLVSPDFLYRVDLVDSNSRVSTKTVTRTAASAYRPLSGY